MIKIKVYRLSSGYRKFNDASIPVADYAYCIYLFGILIHSVTIYSVDDKTEYIMFGKYTIIDSKIKHN